MLGLNGSGKSSLLKIMAGVDDNYEGEVVRMPGIKVGYLEQEPQPVRRDTTVREAVEEAQGDVAAAKKRLEEVYAAYSEPDADFDKLAEEQAQARGDGQCRRRRRARGRRGRAAPAAVGRRRSTSSPAARSAASRFAGCCCPSPTCCCWTSRPTTSTPRASSGSSSSCSAFPAPWSR